MIEALDSLLSAVVSILFSKTLIRPSLIVILLSIKRSNTLEFISFKAYDSSPAVSLYRLLGAQFG